MEIKIYQRQSKTFYCEKQFMEKPLTFLYHTTFGKLCLLPLVTRRYFSKIYALSMQTKRSRQKIVPFIESYHIDMTPYPPLATYKSFNDFFIRQKNATCLEVDDAKNSVIAPADSKLLAVKIADDTTLQIKGVPYTLGSLLQNDVLAKKYRNGDCLIYRLTTDDYHRYCHVDDGTVISQHEIKGGLHTVGPVGTHVVKAYAQNHRYYSELQLTHFGEVIYLEVGALLIGAIHNHQTATQIFNKGAEKGYFSYGGSTIIILYPAKRIRLDADIYEMSAQGYETKVAYGEKVGERYE